jgi:hypothetical protein
MNRGNAKMQGIQQEAIAPPIAAVTRLTPYMRFSLILYGLFPVIAGSLSALQAAGRTNTWPIEYRFAYYIPLGLIVMWSCGLSCTVLSKPARVLRLPLWLLLVIGALVAGEFIKLYVQFIVPVFDKLLPNDVVGGRDVNFTPAGNLRAGLPTVLMWVGLNMAAASFFKIERFGYKAKRKAIAAWATPANGSQGAETAGANKRKPAPYVPNFLIRAGLDSIDHIVALEAQQHYVKIHMHMGSKTILYRFSDAINELGSDSGIQVHRSWWVHKDAVEAMQDVSKKPIVTLKTGTKVPISRTYYLNAHETFSAT